MADFRIRSLANGQSNFAMMIKVLFATSIRARLLSLFLAGVIATGAVSPRFPFYAAHNDSGIALKPGAFSVGERLTYDVRFGPLHVGHGTMLLAGIDTVRGHIAWRAVFTISGGTLFFKVRDSTVSWFDTATLVSLQFVQHLREGRYRADRDYQIYPERASYARLDKPEVPSVREQLDDESFLY